jgi:hypothetical protein
LAEEIWQEVCARFRPLDRRQVRASWADDNLDRRMKMPIDMDDGSRAQAANAENDEKRLDGFHAPFSRRECRIVATRFAMP